MKAENTKDRTRAILQFVGLFLLATVLAGSTFYFPTNAHVHSYDKILQERNGYQKALERQQATKNRITPLLQQLYQGQLRTDTLLEKMKAVNASSFIPLKAELTELQEEAEASRQAYRKVLREESLLNDAFFLRAADFSQMASVDKSIIASQLEALSDRPNQERLRELERDNDALKEQVDQLRERLRACSSRPVADPVQRIDTGLERKVDEYEKKMQDIRLSAQGLKEVATEIERSKVEDRRGGKRYYRIDSMEDFNNRLTRLQDFSNTIIKDSH